MPRTSRFYLPNIPAHVMQRGHNREAEACLCAIHAYVLMTNPIHLLLTPATGDAVSRLVQDCGRQYIRYINDTYRRRGTLWEGRHKGVIVESTAYLLICMRDIELNPVRAGLVARPEDDRWSSDAANAMGADNWVISPHEAYVNLGQTLPQRREAYRALCDTAFTAEALARIRTCTQSGTPMGSERFTAQVEKTLRRKVGSEKRGRPPKARVLNLA
jgi:putative transposase